VLGHRFSGLVAIQPGHALVTTGLYGVVRHPSYLGLLVNSLGWALAFRSGVGVLLTALLDTAMEKPTPRWWSAGSNIPYSRGMIHFFHPGLFKRAGVSTFMWQGDEDQRSVLKDGARSRHNHVVESMHCADR
jgi:hypothetical protein